MNLTTFTLTLNTKVLCCAVVDKFYCKMSGLICNSEVTCYSTNINLSLIGQDCFPLSVLLNATCYIFLIYDWTEKLPETERQV